ncbi:CHAT domain-containing protein [Algoriphagus marinus]|uniref:CHAT domain-containing protein n=1 Tax=Algoriphagus marinus TaxID=1925762 RepID=UPI00094BBDE2|nr:CHAT domain-containing protein [Algoriphagus marinus]
MRYHFCILIFCSFSVGAQTIVELDSLIAAKQENEANRRIQLLFQHLVADEKTGKLPDYLEVYGRIQLKLYDEKSAIQMVDAQLADWDKILISHKVKKDLYLAAASWYQYIGLLEKAYRAQITAFDHAQKQPNVSMQELGMLQVNLGSYAVNTMDIPTAKKHLGIAQKLLENDPDPESIYKINSYLGNMAYFASKLDSAEYYYNKCIQALEKTEPSPRNSFYRPAIVFNNLSGVQSGQGKTTEAIASMNMTIEKLMAYVEVEKDPAQRLSAREFYFQALDNLGGIYKGLGNYRKSQSLMEFSYAGKKAELSEESKDIFLSEIILGQLYLDQAEPEKARKIIIKGIQGLENMDGIYLDYEADGWYALARIEDGYENLELAENYYRKAHNLFNEVFRDEFDLIYLGFLKDFSAFMARQNQGKEAVQIALEAYTYVKSNLGESNLIAFEQELNIGEVYLTVGNYEEASKWSYIALNTLENQFNTNSSFLDSLQNERYKPQAILLSTKSRFLGKSNPSVEELEGMVKELEEGLKVIERRKTFLDADEDRALLITENAAYFGFLEQLYLELYKKSPHQEFLVRLLILHESTFYQKVRARLDQIDVSRFGSLPASFFEEERALKDKMRKAINQQDGGVAQYLSAISAWEKFLQKARTTYPAYYEFRYASLDYTMSNIWESLPIETTVIRYLQIGEGLVALVLSKKDRKLHFFELDYPNAKKVISNYQQEWNNKSNSFANLNSLYKSLWMPLASQIKTQRVMIIPDGALFNLSFEILTPVLISDYRELRENSLLAKHSISYHYSTLLFNYSAKIQSYKSNFVAFAPGFFDEMKAEYLSSIKDSLQIDRSYMKLIPQPFTERLVDKLKKLFGGTVYSQKTSTRDQFAEEAGQYRVLHIGTHAESDNLSPEFSRLIFAKTSENEENSLFAKDIYQMDLSSELAVLIACETGKPIYQPGEGMISLAHAFNYAGSKSLLIGLWKIDEEASSKIAASFYEYLADGMSKDEALRQAKLDYLSIAEGRALSPEFWAGLITMGDSSPIVLQPVRNLKWLLGFAFVILLGVLLLIYIRKKKSSLS